MFKHLYTPRCNVCGEGFKNNIVENDSKWGDFHNKCAEEGIKSAKEDYNSAMKDWEDEQKRQYEHDIATYQELLSLAEDHVMDYIDYQINDDGQGYYDIVDVSKCVGEVRTGEDFFGDADCKIRKVYSDVSSYEDSYGGDIYIHIKGRKYFKMSIGG